MNKSDMEQEVFNLSIPMRDKSVQKLSVTRSDICQWLTEHGRTKLICPDMDELLARFAHAYKLDYNKSLPPKPVGTHGGARPNAGRKPKGGEAGALRYSWRVSRDVWEILQLQDNKTAFIENAIRAYARYLGIKIKKEEG